MTARAWLLAAVAIGACRPLPPAHPPERLRESPPITEALAPPITFGPIAGAATTYDEPAAGEVGRDDLSELRDALQGLAGPGVEIARDARLDRAADDLAAVVRQDGPLGDELVEFALHAHGVVERGQAFVARADGAEAIAAQLRPQLAAKLVYPNARLGVSAGDGLAVVVLAYTIPVHFTALPREVDGVAELTGTVDAAFGNPRVTITHDDRSIEHVEVAIDETGAFHAPIQCAARRGTQWVAVEVDPVIAPVAVVPVSCGAPPPSTFRVEPAANLASADVEARVTALINRERADAHLSPLRPDTPSETAARRYADVMRRYQSVSHDLENRRPTERMEAAGRIPQLVAETTLEADSFAQLTTILLNDPMYRAQVRSPIATHVGVGVTEDRNGRLYLAVEYIQMPPVIDPGELERRVAAQLRQPARTLRTGYRHRRWLHTFGGMPRVDDELTVMARGFADELAAGTPSAIVLADMQREIEHEYGTRYSAIGHIVLPVPDVATIDARNTFHPGAIIDNIAVGVAQSRHDSLLSGKIWVVVLFARY